MSVAHDLNALEEQRRKEAARELVTDAARRLSLLRQQTRSIESGDVATWEAAGSLAQELIRRGTTLELGLLVACAKEVLYFTARRGAAPRDPDLALYLLSGLDTLAMELERLRHDRDLR
jgi:hypothetical protein